MIALGNQTSKSGTPQQEKRLQSITGLELPEGLVYVPQTNLLFVAVGARG